MMDTVSIKITPYRREPVLRLCQRSSAATGRPNMELCPSSSPTSLRPLLIRRDQIDRLGIRFRFSFCAGRSSSSFHRKAEVSSGGWCVKKRGGRVEIERQLVCSGHKVTSEKRNGCSYHLKATSIGEGPSNGRADDQTQP